MDKWASPLFINAYKVENARKRALELFPVCDCGCKEATNVIKVEQLR
jgi:hypothetical protein